MFVAGTACLFISGTEKPSHDLLTTLSGVFLGSGVAILAAMLLSHDEELLSLVASSSMAKSSVDPEQVSAFRKQWVMLHTTRERRGLINLTGGFGWIRAEVDLTSPAAGRLLGSYRTCNPITKETSTFLAEGYLRHGMLVLHVFPTVGVEDIEATFCFPFVQNPEYIAYGTGYHMTYAGKSDLALSPCMLIPEDKPNLLSYPKESGVITDVAIANGLDNHWWDNHRVNVLPRILSQISTTYANVGDLDGKWLFRFYLVYERTSTHTDSAMLVQKAGARYLIQSETHGAVPDGLASTKWMAEMRPVHPFSMTGRWWGLPKAYDQEPSNGDPLVGNRGVLSTEGTLVLNVDVNDRGLYGLFAGRPGSAFRVFAAIAGVRREEVRDGKRELRNADQVEAKLTAMFDVAKELARNSAGPAAPEESAHGNKDDRAAA
jgi:hypothetical protein